MSSVRSATDWLLRTETDAMVRAYGPYWHRIADGFQAKGKRKPEGALGDLDLEEVTDDDIRKGADLAAKYAVKRSTTNGGRSASEHYIAAARRMFARAQKKGWCSSNPAMDVEKPRRNPSTRQALSDEQVEQMWTTIARRSGDPALDLLLVRFHLETGARREGALNMVTASLLEGMQCVKLDEKYGLVRNQPVSKTLLDHLTEHQRVRMKASPKPQDQVFRYKNGDPLTRRRYNTLFARVQEELSWAREQHVSTHHLRHTAITRVERLTSFGIAQRFAGHTPSTVTGSYIKAGVREVAYAVQLLTGEPHPLAG